MNRRIFVFFLFILLALKMAASPNHAASRSSFLGLDKEVAIMTYALDNEQVRSVRALIKSVRDLGGKYRNSKIYVVQGDTENIPGNAIEGMNVKLLPLQMDKAFLDFPLAVKAFAAAQVEEAAKNEAEMLVWLDPGVLVLNPFQALDLEEKFDVAMRPVSLSNNIGLRPGVEPNDYWAPIYRDTGLDYRVLPALKTIVDETDIQPYFNCEVFSVNPELGICREWARLLAKLLRDEDYQRASCTTFTRRLFLHQAVLSGIIASRVKQERIKPLPIVSGYPFNQHERLSSLKQVSCLNELEVVIFDQAWQTNPAWMNKIQIKEPLKKWLFESYQDYLELADHLYRIEGSCNSYLIKTESGSVMIDPAGAAVAPEFFSGILEKFPLKGILLTHAHRDHSDGVAGWTRNKDIPVVAQREYEKFFDYQSDFAGFFARRNAIWSGKPAPVGQPAQTVSHSKPTIFFADEHDFAPGEIHFKMMHNPGETPDHTTIWIPELKAVFVGDNYYEDFINNSTFRGTMIRPIQGYISALDAALALDPEYFLPGHGSPVIGKQRIIRTIGGFRDALRYIYGETVKGINEGKDVHTLMREIRLPPNFKIAQNYGKVAWTVRGIYQEFVGWFDENPASMYAQPASSVYADLLELSGSASLLKRAEEYLDKKDYIKVLHLTEIVLETDPGHHDANEIRMKALAALKAGTNNYIERIWLDYAIRLCGENTRKSQDGKIRKGP